MGVSVDTGGKGGKKSVNADLNLVPYIDLLTCMVAFLLITAVWSQLARLEAHQKGQGQAGEDTPPEKVFKLVVVVNADGFNLVADQDQQPIPKKGDQIRSREARFASSRRSRTRTRTRTTSRSRRKTRSSSRFSSEPWTSP